jgi:hypothetical protein
VVTARNRPTHPFLQHPASILGKLGVTSRRDLRGTETTMTDAPRNLRCSFCARSEHDVEELIAGSAGVYICNTCVDACNRILAAHRAKAG